MLSSGSLHYRHFPVFPCKQNFSVCIIYAAICYRESTLQRLEPLKLAPVYNLRVSNLHSISLVELFAGSTGGSVAHKTLKRDYPLKEEEAFPHWQHSLLTYVNHLSQLVYPLVVDTLFNGTKLHSLT